MTGTTNGIMDRLRNETATHHQRAESRAYEQALFQGTLPRPLYVAGLSQRFLMHEALEQRVRELIAARPALAPIVPEALLQTPNLRADLRHFDVAPESLRPTAATRRFIAAVNAAARDNPLALLGFYYVFEGSKNGARILAGRVKQAYALGDSDGSRYLDPHGAQQRPLWQEFKQQMDAAGFGPADQDAMVAAAKLTFDCIAELDDEVMAAEAVAPASH